ncbi:hypothetical protein LTR37_020931 [Vermiconidia calcicola]|uniref:Uncharacterized protein n=1 Tax=Vermiconidia calcicola TaxID=1690605 RepID=A0ACC3M9V2_9PEZI|nr:hypothetical protein LTR37_020931 [Vermiconidia calcicola]
MKFTLAIASLASLAIAAPQGSYGNGGGFCLSQSCAENLVNRYAAVVAGQASDIGGPVRTARQIIAANFEEQSDSANQQIGRPLGALTVASKQAFIIESQASPPVFLDTQAIFFTCNQINWRWVSTNFGNGAYQVQGIHNFEVNGNGKITQVNFEFNSFAGALDNGYTIFYPNGTQYGQ